MINKKVWTSFGCLKRAVIISESKDPEYWTVKYADDGETGTVTRPFLHFTNEEAKAACVENADYWERQAGLLEELG